MLDPPGTYLLRMAAWAVSVGLIVFAGLTVVGIYAEAPAGAGSADMFASITGLECLLLVTMLRPTSFTPLDGDRALMGFALSVPWSVLHLLAHLDVSPGFGARIVWLVLAQVILLILAIAGWAHCRAGASSQL